MTTMMIIIVIRERSLVMLMKMLLGVVVLAVVVRMAVAVCEGSKRKESSEAKATTEFADAEKRGDDKVDRVEEAACSN